MAELWQSWWTAMNLEEFMQPRDAVGRVQPHGLRFANFLQAMPWMMRVFTRNVPSEHLEFRDIRVTIACPCGERPSVDIGNMKRCECGRYFLHTGRSVKVAFSPQS